jgi:serine/threonine-protein kinase PknG
MAPGKEACAQPNCLGTLEDGYCNVCGLAAPRAATKSSAAVSTATGSSPAERDGSSSRRSISRGPSRSSRRNLGAGLVSVPELPPSEPEQSILTDPKVPDSKRFCFRCDRPLTRERGFCGQCGQKYSFIPTLLTGDMIGGQYEVRGALAYGGLGWIYLAFDRTLSRYVVLKGLLNAEDAIAATVAMAERRFLAAVKHPNIVGIYNFVQHGTEGFIVMEYIGGRTLRDIRRARGPLPVPESIAYIHRILGAVGYLHEQGLLFCDFKPENVMLEGDDVKLIDLGGVRRRDDLKGDIYGTEGYSAPEAGDGPTVASDLYTVGRTLAVLVSDIRGFAKDHRYSLPDPQDEPLFAREESLFRFLLKATAKNPDDRFVSAEEMAEQVMGVLREAVAVETGTPRPAVSALFGGDKLPLNPPSGINPVVVDYRDLPEPAIDLTDPAATLVVGVAAWPDAGHKVAALRQIVDQRPQSIEARLRLAESLLECGSVEEAETILRTLEAEDPWEWRARWYRGRLLLAGGKAAEAQKLFDQVYFDLPGELAPKLAFAMAAEEAGNIEIAARMYDLVARTDPAFASACFGLARCLARRGDRKGAVAALDRVPKTSSMYARSRIEAARALTGNGGAPPTAEELANASAAIEDVTLDPADRRLLEELVYGSALDLVLSRAVAPSAAVRVLGQPLNEDNLRVGLERSYRGMARLAEGREKIRLVDRANHVRPRSLF